MTKFKLAFVLHLNLIFLFSCQDEKPVYDLVISDATVIDPETNMNKKSFIGINADTIACISVEPIKGKKTIHAKGLFVAPGFIDLHAHGQTNKENEFQAFDGVTTALELEVGVDTILGYLSARKGKALINYGASACQLAIRNKVIRKDKKTLQDIFLELRDSSAQKVLKKSDFKFFEKQLLQSLKDGAIGIGVPVGYLPHASIEEIAETYRLAGKWEVPIFTHVREGGSIAFQQAIADAILNKTQLHICHINSMARKDIDFCLNLVEKAQQMNYPISTELYPYTAANTEIGSAIFDDGWQERLACEHHDLQWAQSGERLTPEKFQHYRKTGGSVIVHMMKEDWIQQALKSSVTIIASDGGSFEENGHPRSSGTFARVLGRYVREKKQLNLMDALAKMTIMPAKILENIAPEMKKRGRIQVGCYADLCIFDPKTIIDKATYTNGFKRSQGVHYLIVNGKILIRKQELIPQFYPGIAIAGKLLKKRG